MRVVSKVDGTPALLDEEGRVVVIGPLTDAELRASPVPVQISSTLLAPLDALTNSQLRADPIAVVGPLTESELRREALEVAGPLTNDELRAAPVPVSQSSQPLPTGASTEATLAALLTELQQKTEPAQQQHVIVDSMPADEAGLTDAELRATPVAVTHAGASTEATLALIKAKTDNLDVALSTRAVTGLTDAQLRAAPIPVTGTFSSAGLTDDELRASPVPVLGPLTDAQLRAAAVPVSAASLPLPAGAATQATLAAMLTELGQKTEPADQQHVLVDNFPATQPVSGTVAVSNFPATQAVSGPLTDAQLRAVAVPVSGFPAVQPVSDNGGSLTIDGAVTVSNFPATQPVSGPLTDTQLRAAAVPVSGPLTDAQLRATPVPISGTVSTGGLTDSQLRASPVPVSGSVSTGGLTNAELRASAVPVSAASLPLPAGAATETTLATRLADATFTSRINTQGQKTMATSTPVVLASDQASISVTGPLTDAQLRATPVPVSGTVSTGGLTDAQLRASAVPVSNASLPLPTGAATSALQTQPGVDIGDVTINNAAGAAAVHIQDGGNSITVDGTVGISGTVPISAAALPLPTGAATEATLALIKAKTDNLDVALSTRAVTGLTDGQLRAAPIAVDVGGLTSWAVGQVAVALTAVQIAVTPLTNRRTISLKAMCFVDTLGVSDRIFVGPNNTVSTTNGYGLSNGETIDLDLGPGATLWAVSDASRSPTNGVYVLEIAG